MPQWIERVIALHSKPLSALRVMAALTAASSAAPLNSTERIPAMRPWPTGNVGRHVETEAVRQGYATRALVHDAHKVLDVVDFTRGASYGNAPAACAPVSGRGDARGGQR